VIPGRGSRGLVHCGCGLVNQVAASRVRHPAGCSLTWGKKRGPGPSAGRVAARPGVRQKNRASPTGWRPLRGDPRLRTDDQYQRRLTLRTITTPARTALVCTLGDTHPNCLAHGSPGPGSRRPEPVGVDRGCWPGRAGDRGSLSSAPAGGLMGGRAPRPELATGFGGTPLRGVGALTRQGTRGPGIAAKPARGKASATRTWTPRFPGEGVSSRDSAPAGP